MMRPTRKSKEHALCVVEDEEGDAPSLEEVQAAFEESDLKKSAAIQKGDTVRINDRDYRNDGVYVFDGEVLHELSTEFDDYGHLPERFTVEEYKPDHFSETIEDNSFIWADLTECCTPVHNREAVRLELAAGPSSPLRVNLILYTFDMAGEKHCVCMSEDAEEECLSGRHIYEYELDHLDVDHVVGPYMKRHGIPDNCLICCVGNECDDDPSSE